MNLYLVKLGADEREIIAKNEKEAIKSLVSIRKSEGYRYHKINEYEVKLISKW